MLLRRLLSTALLLSVAGATWVLSEQNAEAGRCCRQRCHRSRCCNTGYSNCGYSGTTCTSGCGTVAPQPATNDGYAPAPSPPSAAPAPAPAPAT